MLPRLMIISDPDHPQGLIAPIAQALTQAPRYPLAIQLRAKGHSDREILGWAQELREITHKAKVELFINARPDIANLAHADGVHLPAQGLPVSEARKLTHESMRIGVSCHDIETLKNAEAQGADYATLSPIAKVPNKGKPLGIDRLREATRTLTLPIFALGGIDLNLARAALDAGSHGIALIRELIFQEDPGRALENFLQLFDSEAAFNG